jgi:hypothetical protein
MIADEVCSKFTVPRSWPGGVGRSRSSRLASRLARPHLLGVIVEANALKSLGRESKGRHYRG